MSFLSSFQINELSDKMSTDLVTLGKLYRAKKDSYLKKSIDISLLDDYVKDGWEEDTSKLKTRAIVRKLKTHSVRFEDDIWCQLYELGYRNLNIDGNFRLPFSINNEDKKQIDVVAVNDDSILLIECKSSLSSRNAPSYKDRLESLKLRMSGYRKAIRQVFGDERKIKFIFATRNIRLNKEGEDQKRLDSIGAFYYDDNTYEYINNLIQKYKKASLYQFLGLIFKGQSINSNTIDVPALKGTMGGKDYYVFSIEPTTLLKLGFVLHRTRANDVEFPTYQRLLVPSRLGGITSFINEGGYFPNSIIINFNTVKNRLTFEASSRVGNSQSKAGILRIPNAYAIAYIIDGQHRVYGYAASKYSETNTIPVVAFSDLDSSEQLKIFMDINQNQKAVSPSLRLDLQEDLLWDSNRFDSRMKALKSSIVKNLANDTSSALYRKISVGEDKAILTFPPFYNALGASSLLPKAKGNKYIVDGLDTSLYDSSNLDHSQSMSKAKQDVSKLISNAYNLLFSDYPNLVDEDNSLILSNRGTYAYIAILGSINKELALRARIDKLTPVDERFDVIKYYLNLLLKKLDSISDSDKKQLLLLLGSGADTAWLRYFQSIINSSAPEYSPSELIDWKQRQDDELQERARKLFVSIERWMKDEVIKSLKHLFGDNWDLEINSIKRDCQVRAEQENERFYKEGLGSKNAVWTDMLSVSDYKKIVEKYWSTGTEMTNFKPLSSKFSLDIGEGFNSKSDKIKWMSYFSVYRNALAHEGTKGKGLNSDEVIFLDMIAQKLNIS